MAVLNIYIRIVFDTELLSQVVVREVDTTELIGVMGCAGTVARVMVDGDGDVVACLCKEKVCVCDGNVHVVVCACITNYHIYRAMTVYTVKLLSRIKFFSHSTTHFVVNKEHDAQSQ